MPHNFSFVIPGKLAGMGLPGMCAPLDGDLLQLKRQNIAAIVSLTEMPLETELIRRMGFVYLHLPIVDFAPPTGGQIAALVNFVREQNAQNRAVAIHCAGGCGRTGTMLACYLVSLGETADQAIDSIRTLRPRSIETSAQEQAIRAYARQISRKN